MKHLFFICLFALIGLASCKKDPRVPESVMPVSTAEKVTEYYPLTLGNYWIYHRYRIDTNLIEYFTGIDSVIISKDTLINGRKFYMEMGTWFGSPFRIFLSDSADFIIHEDGHKLFSHKNFTDTLMTDSVPNFLITYYKMIDKGSIVTIPAGTFSVIEREAITYFLPSDYSWKNPRTATQYFVKKIGMVKETEYYYNSPESLERRLVRYYIAS